MFKISKREIIIKNSKEIIQKEGLKALTISRIVSESKISKRTFYEFFSSKEDLVNNLKEIINDSSLQPVDMKSEIVLRALVLFFKNGYFNTDMESIAAAVGINRATIYSYFSGKEELLEYCISYELEKRREYGNSVIKKNNNPIEIIKKLIEYNCNHANSSLSVLTELSIIFSKTNKQIEKAYNDFLNFRIDMMTQIIKDGKEKGVFSKNVDSTKATKIYLTIFDGINLGTKIYIKSIKDDLFNMIYSYLKGDNSCDNV